MIMEYLLIQPNKILKIEIMHHSLNTLQHRVFKLEINIRNTSIKSPNTCKLNNAVLNSHKWHKEKIAKEKCFYMF